MTLAQLNALPAEEMRDEFLRCCGSRRWAESMLKRRPFRLTNDLYTSADEIWNNLSEADWKEAFSHHPKIGDVESLRTKFSSTATWAKCEQSGVAQATDDTLRELARLNEEYERRFGYIYIVCATGKRAEEMLGILRKRINNNPKIEIEIAAKEQSKIFRIRLNKMLDTKLENRIWDGTPSE